eukprot:6154855-Karenia_brevis.AAC.1
MVSCVWVDWGWISGGLGWISGGFRVGWWNAWHCHSKPEADSVFMCSASTALLICIRSSLA